MSTLCCEIVWRIENFSHCRDPLKSNEFRIDSLHKSLWCLILYPIDNSPSEDIGIFLARPLDALAKEIIAGVCEFSVLDDKGSFVMYPAHTKYFSLKKFTILEKKHKTFPWWDLQKVFYEQNRSGFTSFIKKSVFVDQADLFCPKDILTIRCRIFHENEVQTTIFERLFLKTHIAVEKVSCEWEINEVAKLTKESEKVLTVKLDNKQSVEITMSYLPTISEEYIRVQIAGNRHTNVVFTGCIFIHSLPSKEIFLTFNEFIKVLPNEKLFSPLMTQEKLYQNAGKYLLDGKLVLDCEFRLSVNMNIVTLPNKTSFMDLKNESVLRDMITETNSASFLKNDLTQMYHQGLMSDFIIKVGSHEFKVHSNILAARSKVFHRMLETIMKENRDKILTLDDMEEDLFRLFLDYIYTDSTGELNVATAIKLYCTGHLYEIEVLKKKTAIYLKQNIDASNVREILLLSERYDDQELNKAVIQFVFEHEQ